MARKLSIRQAYERGLVQDDTITVNQGDFGKRFTILDARSAVFNRHIIDSVAKKYARIPDQIEYTHIILVDMGGGHYQIIDGQHRISGVSRFGERPVKFDARIYPKHIDVEALLDSLRKDKSHSLADSLDIYRGRSNWRASFDSSIVNIANRGNNKRYTYSTVVASAIHAQSIISKGAFDVTKPLKRHVERSWTSTLCEDVICPGSAPILGVDTFVEWLEWWDTHVMDQVGTKKQKVLRSRHSLTGCFLWRYYNASSFAESACDTKAMLRVADRFVRLSNSDADNLRAVMRMENMALSMSQFMKIVNHGAKTQIFEVLGISGR